MARKPSNGILPRTMKDGFVTIGIWFGIYVAITAFTFVQTIVDCGTDRSCEAGYGLMGALTIGAFGSLLILVIRLMVRLRAEMDVPADDAGLDYSE